jgi:protein-disulfide isomerase
LCLAILLPWPAAAQPGGVSLEGIGHDRGSAKAKVFIVEFGDFGCGYCAKFAAETYPRLDSAYIQPGRVFWKFVPFVTGNFRNSREMAEGAECAGEQNAFWKMHDLLYARRKEWMAADQPRVLLARYARELKLDAARFARCSNDTAVHLRVMHNDLLASTLYIRGTPTFFVNGRAIPGAIPFDLFKQVIDEASR